MNVEERITLDKFQLRPYQEEIWDAVENKGYRKLMVVLPRRAGKDLTCFNLAIRTCLSKVCMVMYCLPTYAQCRSVIWDAIAIDGTRFLDYIPKSIISKINQNEMKITFSNGSILKLIGSDSYNTSLIGSNPYAIFFSEWARCDPKAYEFARPILAASGGYCVMLTTPFGKNHAYHMFKLAQELPDWCVIYKTVDDTHHISQETLEQEKAQMHPELFAQEYMCSWDRGVQGAYFGLSLENLRKNGQICPVAWEPGLLVYSAWDIGVNDATTIICWQMVGDGTVIRIIDCVSNNNVGLDWYAKWIQDKPYRWGTHWAPHDIAVREWGGGAITRYEKAAQLDINFVTLPQTSVFDGIENVLTHFPKFWIDSTRCKRLIDALENYYREWDEEKQVYRDRPVKNWASHFCDSLRYMCMAIPRSNKGMSSQDFERAKNEALYGYNSQLPRLMDPNFNYKGY